MHACNWGRYLNIVKLHDHSRQNLADVAFGNEVGDRRKAAGYLSPARACERGSSPASRVCLKWESEGETSRELSVVVSCVNSGKPCTFLHAFVFLSEYEIFQ